MTRANPPSLPTNRPVLRDCMTGQESDVYDLSLVSHRRVLNDLVRAVLAAPLSACRGALLDERAESLVSGEA